MATVSFVSYTGGSADTVRTNNYIADGHGDEALIRTNRYISGDHACGNRCIGVNCPSDPVLASEHMEQLRALYDHNHAGRGLKGATDGEQGAAHYQLIISWEPGEHVPSEERYAMAQELIQRTRLKDHANLLAAHENKAHDHIHDSVSAFSLDGTHKLSMNKEFLYDLRREMDRICVAHGYSIVEAPELWGDKAYKEWFDCVRDLDVVTIHPPRSKRVKDKSVEEKYAAAKAEEHLARKALHEELLKPRKMTEENRGTHFYALPNVYDPARPYQPLYIYAMDEDGKRYSPLQLDYLLQYAWATKCLKQTEKMKDFPGKRYLMTRMSWAQENAGQAFFLMQKLDIGTKSELYAHLKAVGRDRTKYLRDIAYQEKVLATAKETGNTAKFERAEARKAHAEKMLAQRRDEYRNLRRALSVLKNMDSGHEWRAFEEELLRKSADNLKIRSDTEAALRAHYRDIGQLMGMSQEEIDKIIDDAKATAMDDIEEVWTVSYVSFSVTYKRSRSGRMSAVYAFIGAKYTEARSVRRGFLQDLYEGGPVGQAAYSVLLFPAIIVEYKMRWDAYEVSSLAKRTAEEVHWHNQNAMSQLETAKTKLALKLLNHDEDAVESAWEEFYKEADKLIQRTKQLQAQEAKLEKKGLSPAGVRDMEREVENVKALRKSTLDAQIGGANAAQGARIRAKKEEKEGPTR